MITIKSKLETHYGVKSNPFEHKEVDDSQRTVDLVANTYLYFDHDKDVLFPGCAKKSIEERGHNSKAPGKIKHLKGHVLNDMIAIPRLISEEMFDGKNVLRANSYFPESEDSENELINYKAGMYDQHSIGFRYLQLALASPTGEDEDRKLWDEVMPLLINPEDAEKVGFMYVCKEIALYEYSTVAFGANRLTPYLGSKSENKTVRYNNLLTKLDHVLKNREIDKFTLEMHERQLKQMLFEIMTEESETKPLRKESKELPPQKFDVHAYLNNFNFKL